MPEEGPVGSGNDKEKLIGPQSPARGVQMSEEELAEENALLSHRVRTDALTGVASRAPRCVPNTSGRRA